MMRTLSSLLGAAAILAVAGCGTVSPTGRVSPATQAPTTTSSPDELFTPSPAGSASASAIGGDPAAAVSRYFQALAAGDCQTAYAMLTDPLLSRVGSAAALCSSGTAARSATVGPTSGNPASGQVTVQAVVTDREGSIVDESVVVVFQDGQWQLSDILANPTQGGPAGTIDMPTVIATIQHQWAGNGGAPTLSCSRSGSFPAVPGDSFQCTYTDGSGHSGTVTVSVTSAQGDWTWSASG